jgi:hypothetical protein
MLAITDAPRLLPVPRDVVMREARFAYRLERERERLQRHWRNLPIPDRGWISLAEIAQDLCDCGQCPSLSEATYFVLRQFSNRLLAGGHARYVFDGDDCDFDATELGVVFTQKNEIGIQTELMKDSTTRLLADLAEHLFVRIASVQQRARTWGWKWSEGGAEEHASSLGTETTPEPPSPPAGSDRCPALTEDNVERWFADRVAKWPDSVPAPSEADDWVAFGGHFGRDSAPRETFRELRRKYTPADWRKQGPRLPWGMLRQKVGNLPMRN